MLKRSFIVSLLLTLIVIPMSSLAQTPAVTNGLNWLESTQTIDGNWPGVATEEFVATATATDALFHLNPASSDYSQGVQWLEGRPESPTDLLARRIIALTRAGHTTTSEVAQLLALRDTVGGWGGESGYLYNLLDTALALQALKAANATNLTNINATLATLTTAQNSDGGWGFSSGSASNVNFTAIVSATLQQFPQQAVIAMAVNKATAYLRTQQNIDGGFGRSPSTVYETALAYNALVAVSTDATLLGGAVNYLVTTQSANGSWNDDSYSTALALKALHLSEEKPLPPPPPPVGGTITGTVVDAFTNQRLSDVVVVLASNPLVNMTTDSSGNFSLSDIPAGGQLLNFSKPGYAADAVSASVSNDSVVSLGNIPLISRYATGTITGVISDTTGKPLAAVAIAVSGAWSGSAVTGVDGSFTFDFVTPGAVTLTATKAGYLNASGTGFVYARTALTFSPRLTTTPSQVTTGTIVGRVIDKQWKLPIGHLPDEEGVTVKLAGGIVVEPDPNNGGYFTIPGLAPNTYQVTVGMNGFNSHTFRVVVTEGSVIDLGTILLDMGFAMTLTGKVTDALSGAPIYGAEVAVAGTTQTARTDFSGTYAIADIAHPAELVVNAGASGYNGRSFVVQTSPWAETLDIALTPQATTGSLVGTVIDVSTNLPLNGVTLTLVDDPAINATTNSSGDFIFNMIPNGGQQVQMLLNGYAQRTLTTMIFAGTVNKVGTIGLSPTPMAAHVEGVVWDAVANQPFAGVDIQVTGTGFWQTVTAVDGSYRISNVNPGEITVAATGGPKPGYFGASFTGPLAPGGVVIFTPALSTTPPPGVLKGTVTDIGDDLPIQGAIVILRPTPAGIDPVVTDATGAFTLSEIPVGSYTASISAPGYWGQNVNVDIESGYLGEAIIDVYLQKPGSSTTVVGKIIDASNGNPIVGADVSIIGTDLSAKTDATGAYMLGGITQKSFFINASSTGYDGKTLSLSANDYGIYTVDFSLTSSQSGYLKVVSFVTDKPAYNAYETVTTKIEVQNDSVIAVPCYLSFSVMNENNTIIYMQDAVWVSDGTSNSQFTFNPGLNEPISVYFESDNFGPGTYSIEIYMSSEEHGKIFSETKTYFSIEPTQAIGTMTIFPQPAYTNLGATEQIIVQAEIINLSNVKTDMNISYNLLSPSGLILHSGVGFISLLPEEKTKSVTFDTFPLIFNSGSGNYPINVQIVSGPSPINLAGKSVSVAPGIRIEPSQSLTPTTVIPDGDKRIQIKINLKGVEQL